MKHFLTLLDYSAEQLTEMLDLGLKLKQERKAGIKHDHHLAGKCIALIFEKSSTRTRVSFEIGVKDLGGHPMFLSTNDIQLGRGESIADTARVLARYVDGMMLRTFGQERIEELAKYSSVPVINGLSNEYHPCQIMADVMTAYEKFGKIKGMKVAFIGDGNNVAHSWLNAAARLGFDVTIASPEGYEPNPAILARAKEEAKATGAKLHTCRDPKEAVAGADVVTTDVWASMGQEAEVAKRKEQFKTYQVDSKLMSLAAPHAIFMHCLPAHKGEEVTEEVFESPASVVFDEAENRLHAQKGVMVYLFR
jgi:ornithine carbamoyltransferase